MPKNRSKRGRYINVRSHVRRRAWERYRIQFTREKESDIIRLIRNRWASEEKGELILIEDQSNSRSIFDVWNRQDRIWMRVVYSRAKHQIVTFLSLNCLDNGRIVLLPSHVPEV